MDDSKGNVIVRTSNTISRLMTGTNRNLLDIGVFLLRATVGLVLFMTGAGKLFGWFGGFGMEATLGFFSKMGIAAPLTYLSTYTETFGGLLLILGLFTRPVAIAVTVNMLVATITMMPKGFIIGGAAYPFTILVSSVIIFLSGPMGLSLDAALFKRNGAGDEQRSDHITWSGRQ